MKHHALPTPEQIDARLAALADALADAERTVAQLALPAAAGRTDAVNDLAKAQAKITQLNFERDVLEKARAAAATQVDEAALAEAARLRAEAKAQAVKHAARLVDMAQRADTLAAEFRSLVETMPDVEAELWRLLQEAGEEVSDGTVGRRGLARHAVNAVTSATLAPSLRPRAVADVAGVAWACLLDKEI